MKKSSKIILALIIILLLIAMGVGGYFLVKISKDSSEKISSLENQIESLKKDTDTQDKNEVSSDTQKENEPASKNENSSNKKGETEKANEAIRKALKDEKWIEKNILDKKAEAPVYVDERDFAEADGEYCPPEKYTFAKISDTKYVVYDDDFQLVLVTYDGEKVITSKKSIYSYYSLRIDLNKGIVRVDDIEDSNYGPSEMVASIYKISGNEFVPILTQSLDQEYFYKNGVECSKDEYMTNISEYKTGYNFVQINTELTNENIDKYVK